MTTVLVVCTGNICRSPAAEAVLQRALAEAGLASAVVVDSAGTTGWHEGERAHELSRSVGPIADTTWATGRGLCFDRDSDRFDLLLVMDGSHERWLLDRASGRRNPLAVGALRYLRSFDPLCTRTTGLDDPWGTRSRPTSGCTTRSRRQYPASSNT